MDSPLFVLQSYVARKIDITMHDGSIYFGDEYSLPENVMTNWIAYGSDKNGSTKEYYSLKTLVFFLQNLQHQHSVYVRDAVSANIPAVRRPDRRNLISFLRSEISTCESIDKFVPNNTKAVLLAPSSTSGGGPAGVIRRREADEARENIKKARIQVDTKKLKAQLEQKLKATKENCVVTDDLKSLSDTMTVERIAEIKAKRLAKKRITIISTQDEDLDVLENVEMDQSEVPMSLDYDNKIRDIFARERTYRNRTNILQCPTKEFAINIFAVLKNIKFREACKKPDYKPPAYQSSTFPSTPIDGFVKVKPEPPAYNRYDQQRFTKQEETTSGFTIQTTASYHGSSIQAVMSGENPQLAPSPVISSQSTAGALLAQKRKRPSTIPIIIVPNSNSSLITTHNATDILQDCRFVSNDQKRASGARKENDLLIQRRKIEGLTVPYRITDNPLRLKVEDWKRVVAVFVLGPTWQFKGWPFEGNPVDIFSKITAFHLKYDDMPLDANVARWAVTTLNVNRTKRHLDKAALLQFWKRLDEETVKKKNILRL